MKEVLAQPDFYKFVFYIQKIYLESKNQSLNYGTKGGCLEKDYPTFLYSKEFYYFISCVTDRFNPLAILSPNSASAL
jgi:hypothetical protein